MDYKVLITKDQSKGLNRSKKNALGILRANKFIVHNIFVERVKKIALCNDQEEILHIIPRKAYEEYITPELEFIKEE